MVILYHPGRWHGSILGKKCVWFHYFKQALNSPFLYKCKYKNIYLCCWNTELFLEYLTRRRRSMAYWKRLDKIGFSERKLVVVQCYCLWYWRARILGTSSVLVNPHGRLKGRLSWKWMESHRNLSAGICRGVKPGSASSGQLILILIQGRWYSLLYMRKGRKKESR